MNDSRKKNYRWILILITLLIIGVALLYFWAAEETEAEDLGREVSRDERVDAEPLHPWKPGPGAALARKHCTPCHAADLVVQNRMDAEGWEATIRWMQRTQNLWDLGEDEAPLIEYLAKNYAPQFEGRRKPLSEVDWYVLED